MTSTAGTPGSVAATTALLQAELPRLEEHQQTLEKELAHVTERLESVRNALTALQALTAAPQVQEPAAPDNAPETKPAPSASTEAELATGPKSTAQTESAPVTHETDTPQAPEEEAAATPPAPTRRRTRKAPAATGRKQPTQASKKEKQKSRPAKKTTAARRTASTTAKKTAPVTTPKDSSGLTEQIVEFLATTDGSPVRARDVAQALGRDDTTGSINAVRSTLDRLVATSRAHRAGRGLYQSPTT
ncbi:hypothetical protein OG883_38160 [Streptomyces sp. NBC_01142]|uniref:hypothetical protein n=1 Tax=Streptomyces sp. NBC_01142 TaxID=2975865 RepID=UPI002257B141|nr:hypothetical protein [Streptomyces sp. NBC_01142]MCX4825578.1 hypothetical protein [Streptomyces sp. NBC_01142]